MKARNIFGLAWIALFCFMMLTSCSDSDVASQVAGLYAQEGGGHSYFCVWRNGEWSFFSIGSHPAYFNHYLNKPVAADPNWLVFGSGGDSVELKDMGGTELLRAPVDRDKSSGEFTRELLTKVGCPDVSRLHYVGPEAVAGTVIEFAVKRSGSGQIDELTWERPQNGEGSPIVFRRTTHHAWNPDM